MALTRKYLSAMGIGEDQIDQIITAHTEVTNALKEERDKYKADADKLSDVQKELNDLKKASNDDDKNPWKVKYDALKEEYTEYKNGIDKQNLDKSKTDKLKAVLKEIGISDKIVSSVVRITNLDGIKLDDDGNIVGADDLKTKLKDEWSDFIVKSEEKGAEVANPPKTETGKKMSKEDIMKIKDTSERQKAIAENLKLFGA